MLITVEDYWNNVDIFLHPTNEYDYLFLFNGEKIYRLIHRIEEDSFYIPKVIKNEKGHNEAFSVDIAKDDLIEVEFRNFAEEFKKLKEKSVKANKLIEKYQKAKKFEDILDE